MSSTNRSDARDAHIADYYKTPVPAIVDFLMEYFDDTQDDWTDKAILDPCAGGSATESMSYPEALSKWNLTPDTMDIRTDSPAEWAGRNYLMEAMGIDYDVVITNPPFNIALDVIQKALDDAPVGGLVIMLLRLNFFGSQGRKAWLQANMPTYCYVHAKRMAFTSKGTDSIEYAHNVWIKGQQPKFTKLRVI
jgi:hypothetical protein